MTMSFPHDLYLFFDGHDWPKEPFSGLVFNEGGQERLSGAVGQGMQQLLSCLASEQVREKIEPVGEGMVTLDKSLTDGLEVFYRCTQLSQITDGKALHFALIENEWPSLTNQTAKVSFDRKLQAAIEKVRLPKTEGGLYLFIGEPGSGRTTAAAATYGHLCESFEGVGWAVSTSHEVVMKGQKGRSVAFQLETSTDTNLASSVRQASGLFPRTGRKFLYVSEIDSHAEFEAVMDAVFRGVIVVTTLRSTDIEFAIERLVKGIHLKGTQLARTLKLICRSYKHPQTQRITYQCLPMYRPETIAMVKNGTVNKHLKLELEQIENDLKR
ncbi:P-loop NTPase family protein [Marinobacterium jannaschii]|uniref:hypothetical protein n=1 Tax=Marinobacterium jannaschii TaxID=64970 RepID=UPI0004883A80|nr:hypothetical protein [Marinobacterium jannaschii]